jgi:uncharacterized protein YndB with AHSA1/START domain
MSGQLIIKNSIAINAPVEKVWDMLTNPEQTKKYMFGCETVSDWKAGSPLLWKGNYEGTEMIFVKGIILEIEPNRLLRYSVIDPNAAMEDIPENYLHVTYSLRAENGQTVLTVTQDGFENAADAEKRYKDSYNNGEGWNPVLAEIKKLLEAG